MAKNEGGRWVTINGAHIFLKDAKGGLNDQATNASPHNLRIPPKAHSPGHENPPTGTRTQHTGLQSMDTPAGGSRPAWMAATNARQIAKSERLARSFKAPGKPVPKGTPMPKMTPLPLPRGDTNREHQSSEDQTMRVHLYGGGYTK